MRKYLILFLLIFVISCTAPQSIEDLQIRLDILYEHTVLMEDYYSIEEMEMFGLDISHISDTELSMDEKILELEKAYDYKTKGDYQKKITQLEDQMIKIMNELIEYEKGKN